MAAAGQSRPIRLLSLDGGGIRGLSSLAILQSIMAKVNEGRRPEKRLEPHEVFDLIGGTGTGGLFAIMLGRLRMPLKEVESSFLEMLKNILQNPKRASFGKRGIFSSKVLEKEIKNIVERHTTSMTRLREPGQRQVEMPSPSCKVFVCANHPGSKEAAILRSYDNEQIFFVNPDYASLEIWKAALATSAAKSFFDPVTIKDMQFFSETASSYNNPMSLVYDEAKHLWPTSNDLFLLSIGTGRASCFSSRKLTRVLRATAMETDKVASDFLNNHPNMVTLGHLFRFDLSRELGIDEYKEQDTIAIETDHYIS